MNTFVKTILGAALVLTLVACGHGATRVTFIRHGFGKHQELILAGKVQEGNNTRDPELTSKGVVQAKKAGERLAKHNFDVVVVSPLRRAIETARVIFEGRNTKIVALTDVAEFCATPNCQGTSVAILRRDFPDVDFSSIPESWGAKSNDESLQQLHDRQDRFKRWLNNQNGKSVAVVSHGEFLFRLLGKEFSNCQAVNTEFLQGKFELIQ